MWPIGLASLLCVVDGIDPLRSQLLSLSKGKELTLTIHHQPKCVGELKKSDQRLHEGLKQQPV